MKILVFGSLNIDHVYQVDHFVRPGETMASLDLRLFCGGKGLNQSIAFAKSGHKTYHAGAVGAGDSDMLIEMLKKAGVCTEFIRKKEGPSGHAIIQTTPEGENSILLYGGANRRLTREDVDFVLGHFSQGDVLVLQNEINEIPYIMEKAKAAGMRIVLNPSPADESILGLPLGDADYMILNEVEGEVISGVSRSDEEGILRALMGRFPDTQVVLTLGRKGSAYGYQDKVCRQPVYEVKTVDTTGAGDTFTGFFMGSILRGSSVEEALKMASMAAALAVSRSGASSAIPTWSEVEDFENQGG